MEDYLLGTKFAVVTNNVANMYFKTQRKLSRKQARWQEFLGEFDFDGLLYAKGGQVFVPTGTLRRRLLRKTNDPQWAEHPGIDRMVTLLAHRYYWPRMEEDVEAYVRTCLVCQLDKVERKKEAGLLQPLPIPEVPWQSISMDFISGFPKVNGMASVLVVVDHFSKYGIFIVAPHACPAETATELFFKNVTKYFGVPKDIVSDRDARFTERFWTTLFNMMGTELKFSTANHPQTDGQTKRVNALVEDYLRHYMSASQRNWLIGNNQRRPHEISVQKTGGKCPATYRFARSKQEQLDEAKDSLAKAQRRLKKYAEMGRRHVEFGVGDQVLLKLTPQIWKKISSKSVHRGLIPKYDGPFEFEEKLDEYWVVREGVTPPTRASVLLVGVVCNPLLGWCPAGVAGVRIRRGTVSTWSDIVMDSQTVGRAAKQHCARASMLRTTDGWAWQMRALNTIAWRSTWQQCARAGMPRIVGGRAW
ncbi:Transposon Ty3-I Gag-Pol polyprotein [Sesamum angolense]|uniref:Transposon Ty3-I Gag-Pol polyprotein n=1 Tax=Sesamum angolense TaxID=2727404 RepID=A0AAE2BZ64_9LAMI|nr:Transposon Ty3-I Gag-Pol polyprotein [Sesamum angolense]